MADAIYPKFLEASFQAEIDLLSNNIKAALVDTADYMYSDVHEFLDDIPAAAREETSPNLTGKSVTNGTFDADDVLFSGTSGDDCEALVLYVDTGTASTSRLICYLDSLSGLPVQLGPDVQIRWDDDGIFSLAIVSPYAPITATNPTLFVPLKYASTDADGQILFKDSLCTIPVTSIGDPVGGVLWDGVIVATQSTDADRPTWQGESVGVTFIPGRFLRLGSYQFSTSPGMTYFTRGKPTGTVSEFAIMYDQGLFANSSLAFGVDTDRYLINSPGGSGGELTDGLLAGSVSTAVTVRAEFEFSSEQRLFIDDAIIDSAAITTPQVTSSEIDTSRPSALGTQAKSTDTERRYDGSIEAFLYYDDLLSAAVKDDIEAALGGL